MIKKMRMRDEGITLIELIVSIAITSIIIAALVQLVMYGVRQYQYKNLEHQQYLLMDHIEDVLSQEMRYANEVLITDDDSGILGPDYVRIYTDNRGIVSEANGLETILCDSSLYGARTVSISFDADRETDITKAAASAIFVSVHIDEGKDWEMVKTFTVKSLNISNEQRVEIAIGASGQIIVYK